MKKEFFVFRAKQSLSFERGSVKYYISSASATESFKDFSIEKSGKKTSRDFLKQLTDSLSNSKCETDPLLYCAKLIKSGIWSKNTLDFMTTLFANVNQRTQFNPLQFAEEMFAPFGFCPVNSARSIVSLFTPSNADEVVYALSFCFECLLYSKQCESMSLYKKFAENNVRDLTSYNHLAERKDPPIDKEGSPIQKMPQIVIIIDELSDLMMAAPNEIEDYI